MSGINTEIENELRHTIERLEREHQDLLAIYYEMQGDWLKNLRQFMAGFFQLVFSLLSLACITLIVFLVLSEPVAIAEYIDITDPSVEEIRDLATGILILQVLAGIIGLFSGIISNLLGKVRRRNRRYREAALMLEQVIHRTRTDLERAQEKSKGFREFALEHERKAGERQQPK